MATSRRLRLGVSVDGAGHHPAAWRARDVDGTRLFTAGYLAEQVLHAERGGLDFVTLGDAFGVQPGGEGRVRGRFDAVLALAAVAPLTRSIGLVPVTDATHTEPFHLAKNIATLDHVSAGRAGWWPTVSTTTEVAELFGRKPAAPFSELWAEADEVIDVVRRLWDSWEDDAVIRDVATGRYLDRDKVHYVDFTGRFFAVRGPSITPRSPQGQPLVVIDGTDAEARDVAARWADVVIVDETGADAAQAARERIRHLVSDAGRDPDDVSVIAAIGVLLDESDEAAAEARARLDELDAAGTADRWAYTGGPRAFADRLAALFADRAADGVLVHPAVLAPTLHHLVDDVVPRLAARAVLDDQAPGPTLRQRFGLDRPANRYAVTP